MLIGYQGESLDKYITKIQMVLDNTFLSDLDDLYFKHRDVVNLIIDNFDKITPSFYIGSKESLQITGLDINIDRLYDIIEVSDNVQFNHYKEFITDYVKFLRDKIITNFSTDYEYIEELSKIYGKFNCNEKYVRSILRERYDAVSSNYSVESDMIIPDILRDVMTIFKIV